MGCWPVATSTMDRRRWPRPTGPSIHSPSPSGAGWRTTSRIRLSTVSSTVSRGLKLTMPTIPHMARYRLSTEKPRSSKRTTSLPRPKESPVRPAPSPRSGATSGAFPTAGPGPLGRIHGHGHRPQLKAHGHHVLRGPVEVVHQDPVARLDEEHAAPMHHGILEPRIAVVEGIGEVVRRVGLPVLESRRGPPKPAEGRRRHRLALPVQRDGAVGHGSAEVIAPARVSVAEGARIDQARLAERRALDGEKVGVTVSPAHRAAERARIEDELMGAGPPIAPHHGITAVREAARRRPGWPFGGELRKRGRPASSEQP